MGSRTVLHFQCSVGNTVLLLIPCTELRISANASPYGCLGFVINSTLNILSARGLTHSERQRNVKNVALRSAELHNTKTHGGKNSPSVQKFCAYGRMRPTIPPADLPWVHGL